MAHPLRIIKKSLSSLCGTFGCSRTPRLEGRGFNVRDITRVVVVLHGAGL
ncbi:MAG: hypothetical protein AABY02_01940 [Nanoarchaeota archaeon]